jgi:hypothetical protein
MATIVASQDTRKYTELISLTGVEKGETVVIRAVDEGYTADTVFLDFAKALAKYLKKEC